MEPKLEIELTLFPNQHLFIFLAVIQCVGTAGSFDSHHDYGILSLLSFFLIHRKVWFLVLLNRGFL